jgi:hypothetical protein
MKENLGKVETKYWEQEKTKAKTRILTEKT